jgi:hypothetical protein
LPVPLFIVTQRMIEAWQAGRVMAQLDDIERQSC